MLVLSRKKGECVVCGEGDNSIVVTVVELRGDKVRLGFEASSRVPIHRQEVWAAIQAERASSENA